MRLWDFIRTLKWRQIYRLLILCLGNPSRLWPTWKATKRSVSLANKYYGLTHQRNTAANAFRHALWNYLVAEACYNDNSDIENTLVWTKKITDIHEELYPNPPLSKAMDLHNNEVGRALFKKNRQGNPEEIISLLRAKAHESILIKSLEDLSKIPADNLAHMINADNNER
ncbi:MAG: hypothetical protein WBM43_07025 [Flavobacteriaceae bacterium]